MSSTAVHSMDAGYLYEFTGYKLVAVSAAFIPILLVAVGLRFYSRYLRRIPLWLDDYLILWSLFLQVVLCALAIAFVEYAGVGRHLAALQVLSPGTVINYWKFLLIVSFWYFFCVAWPKLALLALYYRLFGTIGSHRAYTHIIFSLAAVILITCITTSIFTFNLCRPFAANWDRSLLKTVPGAYCVNEQDFYRYGSIPNIVTDIFMLALPMPVVWNLNVSTKNRIGLTVVFITGSLGLATSIFRFTSFFGGSATGDGTWNSVELMTWTVVEPGVYLITACLPTYRPLYQKIMGIRESGAGNSDPVSDRKRYLSVGNSKKKPDTLHGHLSGDHTTVTYTDLNDTSDKTKIEEENIPLAQYTRRERKEEKDGVVTVEDRIVMALRQAYGLERHVLNKGVMH